MPQMRLTAPALSSEIWTAAAWRKFSAAWRARAGQHDQELAAAARSKQDSGQAEFGQQGARQHFAEQRKPLRASGEQIFAGGTHRTSFGGAGQEELFRAQDFTLQQDLFGHSNQKSLEKPSL